MAHEMNGDVEGGVKQMRGKVLEVAAPRGVGGREVRSPLERKDKRHVL